MADEKHHVGALLIDRNAGGEESLDRLQNAHGELPETATRQTPHGSVVHFFEAPLVPVEARWDVARGVEWIGPADASRYAETLGLNGDGLAPLPRWIADVVRRYDAHTETSVLADSARFLQRHGPRIRYVPAWKTWLVYSGGRWEIDETNRVMDLAQDVPREIAKAIATTADRENRVRLEKHLLSVESPRALAEIVRGAEFQPGVAVAPSLLDANPWVLNCPNGTLDLRTFELKPHAPGNLLTRMTNAPCDLAAAAPMWDRFLTVCIPDPEVRSYTQRAVGYSLTGTQKERVFFAMHGRGRNGKSVFFGALRHAFGSYSHHAAMETFLRIDRAGPREDIADLHGPRFVTAIETTEGRSLNERLLKEITGGEPLNTERKYQRRFTFQPQCKIWFGLNELPTTSGALSMRDRLRAVEWPTRFWKDEDDESEHGDAELKADDSILEKLESEATGILAWAIRGAQEWQRQGLGLPTKVREATTDYFETATLDSLAGFIAAQCTIAPKAEYACKEFFDDYTVWCAKNGEKPYSIQRVKNVMTGRGYKHAATKAGKFWIGLRNVSQGVLGDGA